MDPNCQWLPSPDTHRTRARLHYLKSLGKYQTEKPYMLGYDLDVSNGVARTNLQFEVKEVDIHNLRDFKGQINLEENGFELLCLSADDVKMFGRPAEPEDEMEGILRIFRAKFGTQHAFVYDRLTRKEEPEMPLDCYDHKHRPSHSLVVNNPHADQSYEAGLRRIRTHLSAEEFLYFMSGGWRARIINFWKPVNAKISRKPLLLCEPRSVKSNQQLTCDIVSSTYVGESVYLTHSCDHIWYWFAEQEVTEALIFVSFDTHPASGISRCFHSSCDIVRQDKYNSGPPRQSMEARVIVFTKIEESS